MFPFWQKQVDVHVAKVTGGVEADVLLQMGHTDVRLRSLQILLWYM